MKWILLTALAICLGLLCFFFLTPHQPTQPTTNFSSESLTDPGTPNPSLDLESRHPSSKKPTQTSMTLFKEDPPLPKPTEKHPKSDKKHAHRTETMSSFKKAFLQKYSSQWQFQTHNEQIFRIEGGVIKSIGNNPKNIENLARELAEFAGITGPSFSYNSPEGTKKETNFSSTHYVNQSFQNFSVYDGWMQATSNKKQGDVYIIENFIKDVDKNISLEITMTQNEAMDIVKQEYGEEASINVKDAKPKVWANQPPHELIWEFDVLIKDPLSAYAVLVGIESGRIRKQFPTHKN